MLNVIFAGSWVDDMRNGYGIYTYPNGDQYAGDWSDHLRHGQGVYTYDNTKSYYKGTWVNGRRQGAGELVHADHKYVGTFKDDKPKGEGKYVFNHGTELRGHYVVKDVVR